MYPAMKALPLLLAVCSLVACENSSSVLAPASKAPTGGGTDNERLARMERRLDKVIAILEQALPPNEPDPDATYSVPIADIDPVQGPKDAKVTIVEGFEFLCPYCYLVNPTVDKILEKYPNDVRLVSKYLIIHGAPAMAPGMAACAAAKQGKFKEMKAALWNHLFKMDGNRPAMQQDQVSPDNIQKIASDVGVQWAPTASDECQGWITTSQDVLHPLGANATPAFFINGRYISGAQPFENFDKVIQEEIAKADKKIADGIAKADYYQKEVVAKGNKKVKGRFDD
jgi:protein-disulfide isomerase